MERDRVGRRLLETRPRLFNYLWILLLSGGVNRGGGGLHSLLSLFKGRLFFGFWEVAAGSEQLGDHGKPR